MYVKINKLNNAPKPTCFNNVNFPHCVRHSCNKFAMRFVLLSEGTTSDADASPLREDITLSFQLMHKQTKNFPSMYFFLTTKTIPLALKAKTFHTVFGTCAINLQYYRKNTNDNTSRTVAIDSRWVI